MIDWKKIYSDIVAPVISNFTSPPPTPVLIVLSIILLTGVGLMYITWSSGKGKLIGIMLVFIVSFVAYMVISGYFRVKNNTARFETAIITKKFTKKISRKETNTGHTYSDTIYYFEINTSAAFIITEKGKGDYLPNRIIKHECLVDKSIYEQLNVKDKINAVFMPGIDDAIHYIVLGDGSIIK